MANALDILTWVPLGMFWLKGNCNLVDATSSGSFSGVRDGGRIVPAKWFDQRSIGAPRTALD